MTVCVLRFIDKILSSDYLKGPVGLIHVYSFWSHLLSRTTFCQNVLSFLNTPLNEWFNASLLASKTLHLKSTLFSILNPHYKCQLTVVSLNHFTQSLLLLHQSLDCFLSFTPWRACWLLFSLTRMQAPEKQMVDGCVLFNLSIT